MNVLTVYASIGILVAVWFLVVTWPIAAPEKGWAFLAFGALVSLILWPVAVVGLVVTRPAKKSFAPFLLLLLCAILSGCAGKKPSPPPAVLPGVEVGGTITIQKPEVPRPVRIPKQPVQNIFFAFDVDTLKPGQIRHLNALAKWAKKHGKTIHVTGYADTVGSVEYNDSLSLRRAEAVAQRLPWAFVEGLGETVQFGADNKNRRVTMEAR